jgi:hypothetical protein
MLDMFHGAVAAIAQCKHIEFVFFSQSEIPGGRESVGGKVKILEGIAATIELPDIHESNAERGKKSVGRGLVLFEENGSHAAS